MKEDLLIPYDIKILNKNEEYKLNYSIMLQKLDLYEGIVRSNGNSYALFFYRNTKRKIINRKH